MSELRQDPTTREWVIIAPERAKRGQQTPKKKRTAELPEWDDSCPFCPNNITNQTPDFPDNLGILNLLYQGEATIIPNLYPQWKHHAVVILTKSHDVLLDSITSEHIRNGVFTSIKYFENIIKKNPRDQFASINMNYLHPAGATLTHPHLQVLVGDIPSNHQSLLMTHENNFFEANKINIWNELISEEKKKKQRYIGCSGGVNWYLPFSPLGDYEIRAVFSQSNFLNLQKHEIDFFADSLTNILRIYKSLGISSFNFSLLGLLTEEYHKSSRITFSIIPRQNVYENYRNDINFLGFAQNTRFLIYKPEDYFYTFKSLLG